MENRLLRLGFIAPIGFALAVIVLGYLTPGYSHVYHTISELGETGAPYASTASAVFILTGLMLATFGYTFRARLIESGAGSLSGLCIILYAILDFVGSGVFPVDPGGAANTTTATIHVYMTLAGELAALAMPNAFLADTEGLEGWDALKRISKAVFIISIPAAAYLVLNIQRNIPGMNNTPIGLAQRIIITIFLGWIATASYHSK